MSILIGSFSSTVATAAHGTVAGVPIETVTLDALDGVRLQADLHRVAAPRGAAVIAHPHPLYGGDRRAPIVESLFSGLAQVGFTTLRFDFRGVDGSTGEHDDGDAEQLDVLAAIELLELMDPDVPLWLIGYSFGAVVSLNVVDPRVAGWIAIAPPLNASGRYLSDTDHRPKRLFVPQHDQYSPPENSAAVTADWRSTSVATIPAADHFLGGRIAVTRDLVIASLVPDAP